MAKTLNEKLAAAVALVAKYEQAIAAEAILTNIAVGDTVAIKFGRAEKVRTIPGKVVGLNETDNGLQVAVLSDDFKAYTVHVRDVVSNTTAAARDEVVAPVSEVVEVAEEGDPLAAL